jgi:hypothetical protein
VDVAVPNGWESPSRATTWTIAPHSDAPVELYVKTPEKIDSDWQNLEVAVKTESGGEPIHLPLKVNLTKSALPQ